MMSANDCNLTGSAGLPGAPSFVGTKTTTNLVSQANRRRVQSNWSRLPVRERIRFVESLRSLVADNAELLAATAAAVGGRSEAEKLASEILPLADACHWLAKNAERVLAPRYHGSSGRPFWMAGHTFEIQRQPFGLVLVIGPGNYPLFLPAVHALHALAAGNAVRLKPAPGARLVALAFARLAFEAGLDPVLLEVLPESVEAAKQAITSGVDKVVFTGSSENGRTVLAELAATNTPSVMELSGEDCALALEDADIDLVVGALRFGARLNGGRTCMAPRHLIVRAEIAEKLRAKLDAPELDRLLFHEVRDADAAVAYVNAQNFGLGAAIFSRDIARARALAARLKCGFVTINDLIVPTADPRLPFGGIKASGFGATRGEEGLLEMTFPHVVATRRGDWRPHFDTPAPGDAALFSAYIRAIHGRSRFGALGEIFRAIFARRKTPAHTS